MRIEFTERFDIPSATAQQRGHGAHGKTWESPGLRAARAAWQALFERHRPEKPLSGPVIVWVDLFYHNAKAPWAGRPKITRPDYDNLAKVFNDALVAGGIIAEDKFIFDARTVKWEWPGIEMVHFVIKNWEDTTK